MPDNLTRATPGHRSIRLDAAGGAWVEGFKCTDCGAVVPDRTLACRACASRTVPHPFRAAETGALYSWTVVHRSYPGVAVPFVSAIVDLDDGLALKGTLRDVAEDRLRVGLRVRLRFDDAGGARDPDDVPYVGFHFEPEGA